MLYLLLLWQGRPVTAVITSCHTTLWQVHTLRPLQYVLACMHSLWIVSSRLHPQSFCPSNQTGDFYFALALPCPVLYICKENLSKGSKGKQAAVRMATQACWTLQGAVWWSWSASTVQLGHCQIGAQEWWKSDHAAPPQVLPSFVLSFLWFMLHSIFFHASFISMLVCELLQPC